MDNQYLRYKKKGVWPTYDDLHKLHQLLLSPIDKSYYSNLANKYRFPYSNISQTAKSITSKNTRKTVSIQSLTPSSLKMFISQLLSRSFSSPTGNRHTILILNHFVLLFSYLSTTLKDRHLNIRRLERHVEYFHPFFP